MIVNSLVKPALIMPAAVPDKPATPQIDYDVLWSLIVEAPDNEEMFRVILSQLVAQLHAQRGRLFLLNADKSIAEVITEVCSQADLSLQENWKTINMADITHITNQLQLSNPVIINDFQQLATISRTDADILKRQQIKNSIFWPIAIDRTLGGFVSIDNLETMIAQAQVMRLAKVIHSAGKLYDKHRAQTHLASAEVPDKLLQLSFTSVEDGLIIMSPDGKVIDVNRKTCDLFNKESTYFRGKYLQELSEVFPPSCLQLLLRNFGFMKMGFKGQLQEIQIQDKNGETHILEIGSITLIDNNQHQGELIVVRDITFRKGMEVAAQESETKLRRVLESVREGITLSDESGYFEIFNQEMQLITGYSRNEANATKEFIKVIHPPEYLEKARQILAQVTQEGKSTHDTVIKNKQGQEKYIAVATTLLDSQGKKYYLTSYHDETAQKHAEKELKSRNQALEETTQKLNKTAEQLREARDHLEDKVTQKTQELQQKVIEVENLAKFPSEDPFPVLRIQSDGLLLYANSASKALLDMWGTSVGQLVPEGWQQLVKEVFETNNRKIFESELLKQIISFVLVPVKSGNYVNLYGRDISREKEIEQMKNQFIAMVSHQIRTPLTSIRWYSEMLLKAKAENSLNPHQQKITNTIHDTSISLTELVNDLLSISRMESGKIDYNPEPTNIVALVQEVLGEMKPQADKGEVAVEFNPPTIETFSFDPQLIREVYRNLISNAIKYTPAKGKVTITLNQEDNQVVTTIADTGIGIPIQAQESIFTRFYRAQNAVDKEFEGTGLGLSVAKMIIEKAGGSISFVSQENKGTVFTFSIPMQNMI